MLGSLQPDEQGAIHAHAVRNVAIDVPGGLRDISLQGSQALASFGQQFERLGFGQLGDSISVGTAGVGPEKARGRDPKPLAAPLSLLAFERTLFYLIGVLQRQESCAAALALHTGGPRSRRMSRSRGDKPHVCLVSAVLHPRPDEVPRDGPLLGRQVGVAAGEHRAAVSCVIRQALQVPHQLVADAVSSVNSTAVWVEGRRESRLLTGHHGGRPCPCGTALGRCPAATPVTSREARTRMQTC
jgi:hypothetical protein